MMIRVVEELFMDVGLQFCGIDSASTQLFVEFLIGKLCLSSKEGFETFLERFRVAIFLVLFLHTLLLRRDAVKPCFPSRRANFLLRL